MTDIQRGTETGSLPAPDPTTSDKIGMSIMALGNLLMAWVLYTSTDAMTPDYVYRRAAEGTGFIELGSLIVMLIGGISMTMISLRARLQIMPWITLLMTTAGIMWYFVVILHAVDFEGNSNPYVRAREADARAYDSLAVLKDDPSIAALIREARADGRITQGEAYDIINGPAYAAARTAFFQRSTAKTKHDVLTTN